VLDAEHPCLNAALPPFRRKSTASICRYSVLAGNGQLTRAGTQVPVQIYDPRRTNNLCQDGQNETLERRVSSWTVSLAGAAKD